MRRPTRTFGQNFSISTIFLIAESSGNTVRLASVSLRLTNSWKVKKWQIEPQQPQHSHTHTDAHVRTIIVIMINRDWRTAGWNSRLLGQVIFLSRNASYGADQEIMGLLPLRFLLRMTSGCKVLRGRGRRANSADGFCTRRQKWEKISEKKEDNATSYRPRPSGREISGKRTRGRKSNRRVFDLPIFFFFFTNFYPFLSWNLHFFIISIMTFLLKFNYWVE